VVTKKDKYLAAAQKFLERGALDKALAEFLRAVQEDAKDTRTWLRIAEIHVKRADNEKATEVYLRTADLYVEQGFFQRAVAVYKNIIKLAPGFVDAYIKLADIYKQLGLLSDAMQQFELAAAAHSRAGRLKEAMAVMRQIVDLNPDQPVPRIKLAEAASAAGLAEEAVLEFERAGELLKSQGRMDEYLRVAERLLTHRPDNHVLAKQMARLYLERNNGRFALAKLQAAFKSDPHDPQTLDLMARAFELLGQPGKAVSVLKEVAKIHGDTGRSADRLAVFKRIAALDPGDPDARAALSVRSPVPAESASAARPVTAPPLTAAPFPAAAPLPGERPRKRESRITFSALALPVAPAPPRAPELAPIDVTAHRATTGEAMAIATRLLEPTGGATGEVQRIVAEADVFVKYGLIDRASEHLRKVFEIQPNHVGAHERLAAVLLQLGRSGEAVAELELLAEHLVWSQPAAAADYARRALGINARSPRAHAVLEKIEADQMVGAVAEELEEISSGMIEMDTPSPEVTFDEFGEDTDGDGTSLGSREPEESGEETPSSHPSLAVAAYELDAPDAGSEPIPVNEFDAIGNTAGDPRVIPPAPFPASAGRQRMPGAGVEADAEVEVEVEAQPEPGSSGGETGSPFDREPEPDWGLPSRPPRQPVPTPIFAAGRAAAPPPPDLEVAYTGLLGELEQVDFFLDQDLVDEARGLLEDLRLKYPPTPAIDERRARLRAVEESHGLGAVPAAVDSGASAARPYFASPGITPKAMVSGGGEMDLRAHRDLGIAYKDMGLFDAAIGEFSQLMHDPAQEVFALGMIGECHEAKGALGDAVAFYKKALNRPAIGEVEATQLYFQLGSVFQTMGEANEALYFFEKVLKRDAGFRDVKRRISELRGPDGGGPGGQSGDPVFDALFDGKNRR
jgi:pilus assembly protein FimV